MPPVPNGYVDLTQVKEKASVCSAGYGAAEAGEAGKEPCFMGAVSLIPEQSKDGWGRHLANVSPVS